MKAKLLFIAILCLLQTSLFCRPLSFVNATGDSIDVHIVVDNVKQPIVITVPVRSNKVYDPGNATFERIEWSGYGKIGTDDEYTPYYYVINIKETMPGMAMGGALVISSGGEYLYDNKQGGRQAIKFGVATANEITKE